MNGSWLRDLRSNELVILDGGTGSELEQRGMPLRPDVWSALAPLTHFDALQAVHAEFIAAGAQVITTSTFATSRFVLEAGGFGDQFDAINRRAVAAACGARDAAGTHVAVAGSISCLPPAFDVAAYPSAAAERAAYAELAEFLAEGGVDLFVLEMMQDTEHAERACAAAAAVELPFWIGVSCRLAADGESLVMYDFPDIPLDRVLDALLVHEPAAVCVMHSPPQAIAPAVAQIRARWPGYIGAYPEWRSADLAPHDSPEDFAHCAAQWRRDGVAVLGGCCGSTPAHIRALGASMVAESHP